MYKELKKIKHQENKQISFKMEHRSKEFSKGEMKMAENIFAVKTPKYIT